MNSVQEVFWAELAQIQSIGWIPLGKAAYLHVRSDYVVIQIAGVAKAEIVYSNVL